MKGSLNWWMEYGKGFDVALEMDGKAVFDGEAL